MHTGSATCISVWAIVCLRSLTMIVNWQPKTIVSVEYQFIFKNIYLLFSQLHDVYTMSIHKYLST